jgi:hypothetical protein
MFFSQVALCALLCRSIERQKPTVPAIALNDADLSVAIPAALQQIVETLFRDGK